MARTHQVLCYTRSRSARWATRKTTLLINLVVFNDLILSFNEALLTTKCWPGPGADTLNSVSVLTCSQATGEGLKQVITVQLSPTAKVCAGVMKPLCVHEHVRAPVCLCTSVHEHVYVCTCVHVCACVHEYARVPVCMTIHMDVHVCECMSVHT